MGYFFYTNFNKKEESATPSRISLQEAQGIYEKVHQIQISGNLDQLSEVYTDQLDNFLQLQNPSLSLVISEAKKYAEKWKEEKMDILNFEEIAPNEFRYQITYAVRKLENNKIFDYKISGSLKFRNTEKGYRIYSISESSERDYQGFSYQTSVFTKAEKISNGYSLKYNSEILIFTDIKNDLLLDYLYKEVLPSNKYSEFSSSKFFDAQNQQFKNELYELGGNEQAEDSAESYMYSYESSAKMAIKNVDQNFLSVEIYYDTYSGGAHGMQVNRYRNVDYKNNNIVYLTTILDTKSVSWNSLLRRCLNNYSSYSDGTKITDSDLFEPSELTFTENIWFDNKNLYFVYDPYEIASYAQGIIEVKVPFTEIEQWMKEDFKQKIADSKKVDIKKVEK